MIGGKRENNLLDDHTYRHKDIQFRKYALVVAVLGVLGTVFSMIFSGYFTIHWKNGENNADTISAKLAKIKTTISTNNIGTNSERDSKKKYQKSTHNGDTIFNEQDEIFSKEQNNNQQDYLPRKPAIYTFQNYDTKIETDNGQQK